MLAAGALAAESLLVVPVVVPDLVSLLVSDLVYDDPEAAGTLEESLERLSLRYNPEPLKTTPTALKTLRSRPWHSGQTVSASSLNDWTSSKA